MLAVVMSGSVSVSVSVGARIRVSGIDIGSVRASATV